MTHDRLAVVAGASGAIGHTVATQLAAAGWSVIATFRRHRPDPVDGVTWVPFDGSSEAGGRELRSMLHADPRPVSAVLCCIGAPSSKRRIAETNASEFDAVFASNVTAVVRLWHATHESARAGQAGVVVLGSSTTSQLRPGNGAYSAAKAGLEALVATLAAEEAEQGVRVNLVAPSLVDSPLAESILAVKGVTDLVAYYQGLPWGRPLSTHEVASVAIDIATAPHWRYASGQVVRLAVRGE
ncbi:SDR family NAD(P)-dependent oxidoreductase [Nocardia sp. alder85J]|uniref:SDR family NAD(P)-dependent oxidoreductase n=1 Tax=Nocardia sp. alder85J TaxID=2862949 RepID=UPI001CD19AFF|nr:SDR family oxidoreductase [Nocardia sp. alder85J]MCX4098041.1 SDR family oxidoreductase [Nocardia sp. alder85J]